MYLARNLKYLREKKGLSQQELSDDLGLAQPTIGNWENQNRTPDIAAIIKMAEYFCVSLDDLVLKSLSPSTPLYVSNLIYLRKKNHVTQSDIAEILGFKGKSSVCAIEIGSVDISVENLIKLADYFGVTLDQMVKQDLTEDGVITEDEKCDMQKVLQTLEELEKVAQNLKVWVQKNL